MKIDRIGSMFCARIVCTGLLVGALLGGCASAGGKLQTPGVSLVGASMITPDMFSQQFRVRVRIENPNAAPIPIKSIDYSLFLENDGFAEGSSMLPLTVPASSEKEFDLTVQTNFSSSIGRLLSRVNGANSNVIQYTFSGALVLESGHGSKLKFAQSGAVEFKRK